MVFQSCKIDTDIFERIRKEQKDDLEMRKIRKFCAEGWPSKVPVEFKHYYSVRDDLSVVADILLKGSRIVVPCKLTTLYWMISTSCIKEL